MDLEQKFEGVTWDKIVSVNDLERNRNYPNPMAKTITTRIGPAVVLTNRDSLEDPAQVLLPKRYTDVVADHDNKEINTNAVFLNVVYRGVCATTKTNLLAEAM